MPIITKARDVASFNLARCYRMGLIVGLSRLEISAKYSNICSIRPLAETGLYYMISNYPKPPKPTNDLGEIDTKTSMRIINTSKFADMEDDTEDYIDPDSVEEPKIEEQKIEE